MGGRGSSSMTANQPFSVNSEMDNIKLYQSYGYHEPDSDTEESLFLWSRGDYHQAMRQAQAEQKDKFAKLMKDFEAGRFDDEWTRDKVIDLYNKKLRMNVENPGSLYRADQIEKWVSESPNFTGTIYRGLEQGSWDYTQLAGKKVGESVTFKSLTSWSHYDSNAFSHTVSQSGEKQKRVKLVSQGSRHNNAPIAKYSANLEGEVLVSGSESFKIAKITETKDEIRYYLK